MTWNKFLNDSRIRLSERNTEDDLRNEYESDFGRVIFSPATRRMHDKTQVFPLTSDDNIHSRLTHSMEVMAIGHSLGLRICEKEEFIKKTGKTKEELHRIIPVIIKNACIIHDIGNPPFGHFGETAIASYFSEFFAKEEDKDDKDQLVLTPKEKEDFKFFDGNAQGLRVLTKLQTLNTKAGLNLTYASLGAYLKYPNSDDKNKAFIATSKRGVFQSEKDYLKLISENCGLIKDDGSYMRHPLSFLMEAADSICYLVMDIEDGFNKGWYEFSVIKNHLDKFDKIKERTDELIKIEGDGAEITKMVKLRIFLISELVKLAIRNYVKNLDDICIGNYNKELIKDDEQGLAIALNGFCIEHIFSKREIQQLELTGHSVLTGLLNYYIVVP